MLAETVLPELPSDKPLALELKFHVNIIFRYSNAIKTLRKPWALKED